MLKRLLLIIMLATALGAVADSIPAIDYRPQIGGVLRGRWEIVTGRANSGENRFALRNARVWIKGKIAPQMQYYLRADLCDLGKMKFLDGWARYTFGEGFAVQGGQFRIPFGTDAFRGPGTYIFMNRSFIGRDDANNRAVGVQAMYGPSHLPFTIHTGIFSNHSISDHSKWSRHMTYAVKAVAKAGPLSFAGGFQTISPDSVRMNMADASATLTLGEFTAEAEYMYTHYQGKRFRNAHSVNSWVDYGIPLKKGFFHRLSFQGRYEWSTERSLGVRRSDGHLAADAPWRQRLTVGTTLAYVRKPVSCELMLDYEKYFYHQGYTPVPTRDDKVGLELIICF